MNSQEQINPGRQSNGYAEGMAYLTQIMTVGRNDHERSTAQSILAQATAGKLSPEEFALMVYNMKEGKQDYN